MKSKSYNLWCYGLMFLFVALMVLGVSIKAYAAEPDIRYENGRPIVSYNEVGTKIDINYAWNYLSGYYPYDESCKNNYDPFLPGYQYVEDAEHHRSYYIVPDDGYGNNYLLFDDYKITKDGKWLYSGNWHPADMIYMEATDEIYQTGVEFPDYNYGMQIWRYMGNEEEVVVPSYIEGQPVTRISLLVRPYLPRNTIPITEQWRYIHGNYEAPNQYNDGSLPGVDTKCKRIILADTVHSVYYWGDTPRLESIDYGTTPKVLKNQISLSWNRFSGDVTFYEDGTRPYVHSRPTTLDQFGGTIPPGSSFY